MFNKKIILIEKELQATKEDLADLEGYINEFSSFLPLGICTINPPKIIIDINEAFKKLSGYDSVEIVGKSLKSIFLEKEKIENLLNEIQEKEITKHSELTLVSKEKKEIPVGLSISIRKDPDGNFIGYFISFTDITEVKNFREELEEKVKKRTKDLEDSRIALLNILEDDQISKQLAIEEKNKTEAIIYNFSDGLLFFDNKNLLKYFNPQAEIYFKVKNKEVINKEIFFLKKFNKLKILIDFLENKPERIFRKELKIEENLILEITTSPISSIEDSKKIGTLIILHDITREKQIEKTKSEFISVVAHQLRTPLSALKWTLQMLLDEDLGKITLEQREFINKAYQSNQKVVVIVNDLLNVSRIEEGKYLYNPVLVKIENLIKDIMDSNKVLAEKKDISFKFQEPEKCLTEVKVDVEKIKIAIQNLIENAIHYTPKKGIVTVFLKCAKKEIEIRVQDTGIGIPKNKQERLFTKFFRAPNAILIETNGSGLGLYITKNIIEAHNGKIGFESEEGKGSTFWFTLPTFVSQKLRG